MGCLLSCCCESIAVEGISQTRTANNRSTIANAPTSSTIGPNEYLRHASSNPPTNYHAPIITSQSSTVATNKYLHNSRSSPNGYPQCAPTSPQKNPRSNKATSQATARSLANENCYRQSDATSRITRTTTASHPVEENKQANTGTCQPFSIATSNPTAVHRNKLQITTSNYYSKFAATSSKSTTTTSDSVNVNQQAITAINRGPTIIRSQIFQASANSNQSISNRQTEVIVNLYHSNMEYESMAANLNRFIGNIPESNQRPQPIIHTVHTVIFH